MRFVVQDRLGAAAQAGEYASNSLRNLLMKAMTDSRGVPSRCQLSTNSQRMMSAMCCKNPIREGMWLYLLSSAM